MINESAKNILPVLNTAATSSGIIGQLLNIVRREVGQWLLFKPAPKIFDRVKFRSIRWKETDMSGRCFVEKFTNLFSSMWHESIPDNEGGTVIQLPVQLNKKSPYIRGIKVVVREKAEIKLYTFSFRSHTQRRYCRNFLVRTRSLRQNRCISTQSPGSANYRSHKQATFIYEDNKGFEPCRFFLMLGHSSFIQRLISFSSRSLAIRWGFCGVQPSECRSLLIW